MTDRTAIPNASSRRRRTWRWPLILLVTLPLVLALAAQLVLWSDLPRRKLQTLLSERSGLDVRLSHLTLRWNGHTTARDVTIAMSGSAAFASAPRVDLDHAGLLKLVALRPFDLTTVEATGATLTVREDTEGWEVQRVIETVAGSDGDGEPLWLPAIRLDQATVLLAEVGAPVVTYRPVTASVSAPTAGQLSYRLDQGAATSVFGELSLDAGLEHEATFRLDKAAETLRPWVTLRDDARLVGTWTGVLGAGDRTGRLQLRDSTLISTHVAADLEATVQNGGHGPVSLTGTITGHTTREQATYDAEVLVNAEGDTLDDLFFSLVVQTLRWSDPGGALVLDGLELGIGYHDLKLSLRELTLPRAKTVSATGEADLASGRWMLRTSVDDWQSPRFSNELIDVDLDWHGQNQAIVIDHLRVSYGDVTTTSQGTFDPAASPRLQVRQVAILGKYEVDDATSAESAGPAARVEADLRGQFFPLELHGQGQVSAVHVPLVDGTVDEITSPCTFDIHSRGLTFAASSFTLFDGPCNATGSYAWDTEMLAFTIEAEGADLYTLLPMVGAPMQAEGRLEAKVGFTLPRLDTERLTIGGEWTVSDYRQPMISAERGTGKVSWDDGKLRLEEGRFEYDGGVLSGSLRYDSSDDHIRLDVTASRWPLDVPDSPMRLLVDGTTSASGTTGQRVPTADVSVTTTVLVDGAETGSIAVRGNLDEERLRVDQLDGTLAGGRLSGSGTLPLTDWRGLDGELQWSEVDLAQLSQVHPAFAGLVGSATGSARATPSTDRRFPDALAIRAHADIANGTLYDATFTKANVDGFLDENRQSLQQADFQVAGGTIGLTGWHDSSRSHAQVFFTVDAIDCSELETVFLAPEETRLVGRLAGRGSFTHSAPSDTLVGTAAFELSDADIASAPIAHAIYNGLRLGLSGTDPRGRGEARIRLDGKTLEVSDLMYLNRGVAITGRMTIDDVLAGAGSSLDGVAVGALRPLADINLPIIRQLDTLTQWFQGVTSSVRVTGTVGSYNIRPVPFANVASEFGGRGGSR